VLAAVDAAKELPQPSCFTEYELPCEDAAIVTAGGKEICTQRTELHQSATIAVRDLRVRKQSSD
jgi:hypothetical protein